MSEIDHEYWMEQALALASEAAAQGEIPVGALVIAGDQVIGRGYNQSIVARDPTAHAEIVALREAAQLRGNYRLPGTVLYVTIEPCTMCVGAMMHARIETLVFGANEPRAGAVVSRQSLADAEYFNHQLQVISGVLGDQCRSLMQEFFRQRRQGSRL